MVTITMPVKPKSKVTPTDYNTNSLAGKKPADGTITSFGGDTAKTVSVGDILECPTSTTPAGYLRANGGEVSQTTYSALYAVIGNSYTYTTQPGNGQPWRQQYAFNKSIQTDVAGWTTAASLPGTVYDSQAIVTNSRVYLLGGYVNNDWTSPTVYTAPINTDGTLGAWTTTTSLPGTVYYSQAIATNSRVYLLGGVASGGPSSTVYTAPINTDGTLGTWTTATSLPQSVAYSQAIVTNSRVYLLGGYVNGNYSSTVYTAPINTDGTLGTWTTATSLPGTVYASQAIVTNSRVYLLGGVVNGSYSYTVYTAPFTGGLNDYSPYYNGAYTATTSGNFKLPDYTSEEGSTGPYYFIKA